VAVACMTLDEARACECATAIAWKKEKIIARHLEQQFAAAQGITLAQDDGDNHSIDAGSKPDAALTTHLYAQAAGFQNI
jgi:hypothetical protein